MCPGLRFVANCHIRQIHYRLKLPQFGASCINVGQFCYWWTWWRFPWYKRSRENGGRRFWGQSFWYLGTMRSCTQRKELPSWLVWSVRQRIWRIRSSAGLHLFVFYFKRLTRCVLFLNAKVNKKKLISFLIENWNVSHTFCVILKAFEIHFFQNVRVFFLKEKILIDNFFFLWDVIEIFPLIFIVFCFFKKNHINNFRLRFRPEDKIMTKCFKIKK